MSVSVCLSVCLPVSYCPNAYLRNHKTKLHEFFLLIACGRMALFYSGGIVVVLHYVLPVL